MACNNLGTFHSLSKNNKLFLRKLKKTSRLTGGRRIKYFFSLMRTTQRGLRKDKWDPIWNKLLMLTTRRFITKMTANLLGPFDENIAIGWSMIVLSIMAVLLNLLVGCMFICYRQKLLSNINNMFLLSMTSADLCVGITGLVHWILYVSLTKLGTVWKLCGVLPMFGSFFISVFSLATMTGDRLISVKYALRYPSIMTKTRAKLCILVTWLFMLVYLTVQSLIFVYASPWVEVRARALAVGILFVMGSVVLSVSNTILFLLVQRKFAKTKSVSSGTLALDIVTSTEATKSTIKKHCSDTKETSKMQNLTYCEADLSFQVAESYRTSNNESHKSTDESVTRVNRHKNNDSSINPMTGSNTKELQQELSSKQNKNGDSSWSVIEEGDDDIKLATLNGSSPTPVPSKSSRTDNSQCYEHNHLNDNVKKLVLSRKHDSKNSTICILVTVLFIICWFPFAAYYVSFLAGMNYTLPMAKSLLRAGVALATMNSILNPLMYLYKRKDFRAYLRNMLVWKQNTVDVS